VRLITASLKKRSLLRLTAKATQFGKRTFTSWLIESAGTVPIKRRGDYSEDAQLDNTGVMSHLMDVRDSDFLIWDCTRISRVFIQALELGDAVCLFPEGKSRYHPTMAPFKTGGEHLTPRLPDFLLLTSPKSPGSSRIFFPRTGMTRTLRFTSKIVLSPTPTASTGGLMSW
jgi:hypothetical protein